MPPTLFTAAAGDSLGERIQREFPDAKVVKALNTVNASVMTDPARSGREIRPDLRRRRGGGAT
jgi:predicted dinucleotide-binding enzyme